MRPISCPSAFLLPPLNRSARIPTAGATFGATPYRSRPSLCTLRACLCLFLVGHSRGRQIVLQRGPPRPPARHSRSPSSISRLPSCSAMAKTVSRTNAGRNGRSLIPCGPPDSVIRGRPISSIPAQRSSRRDLSMFYGDCTPGGGFAQPRAGLLLSTRAGAAQPPTPLRASSCRALSPSARGPSAYKSRPRPAGPRPRRRPCKRKMYAACPCVKLENHHGTPAPPSPFLVARPPSPFDCGDALAGRLKREIPGGFRDGGDPADAPIFRAARMASTLFCKLSPRGLMAGDGRRQLLLLLWLRFFFPACLLYIISAGSAGRLSLPLRSFVARALR